ncbi:MAG: tetratricopeptide repeat protein [Methylococcaceae bacterium]|nr:tetratricopeptide repeat protein [Methylococcaceae bacterium]
MTTKIHPTCGSIRRFSFFWTGLGAAALSFALPMLNANAAGSAPWIGVTLKDQPCGGKGQGFGPFDYLERRQLGKELKLVEDHYFTKKVETLVSGQEGPIGHDIDYTLRAWPNHHRALVSSIRYADREKGKLEEDVPPPECYLQRAINFSPKDAIPHLLFAIYLHKLGFQEKALQQYKQAEDINPNNPELHYNLGLLLVSMKQYEEAKIHARKAYQAGYPLPGLKRQLTKLGYWQDK